MGDPPLPPDQFNPDFGVTPIPTRLFTDEELTLHLRVTRSTPPPPRIPAQFNPDPGAAQRTPEPPPVFDTTFGLAPTYGLDAVDRELELPRQPVKRKELEETRPVRENRNYGLEPLPDDLKLPRNQPRWNEKIPHEWHNPREYPLAERGEGYPTFGVPVPSRWRVPFMQWKRYDAIKTETPYSDPTLHLWHPYKQSLLKGDAPIIGQDIFLNLTAATLTEFEAHRVPTPSGVSSARPGSAEFYGQGEQYVVQHYMSFGAELFKGETSFKPVHWAIKVQPVFNINYVHTRETGTIAPDPRGIDRGPNPPPPNPGAISNPGDVSGVIDTGLDPAGGSFVGQKHTTRTKDFFALQEYFGEVHLGDLSENYDFFAVRAGNQGLNTDFRGFIFNDVNLGARIFGNYDNNRLQYNAAFFEMREKDTFSDLNTFDQRNQHVFVANAYRQDFLWPGYTAQLSFHANLDDADRQYDRAGNVVRPTPIGTVADHGLKAYYLGWAGDGHIGRWNVSHAFYQALGTDDFNGLAGQPADIDARMFALELSYDRDWVRYKASFFYASGDDNAEDNHANGFDSILDNPNFTGGPFSYYVRQGFNLGGSAVALKQRNSLIPNLRTSKTQGQANFVNPGVFLGGLGMDMDLTPKLRSFMNVNYVRLVETDPIKTALLTDKVDNELGWDLSLGVTYRPFLTDNLVLAAGFGAFLPGRGYKDIYKRSTDPVSNFNSLSGAGRADDFLYSGLLVITLTY